MVLGDGQIHPSRLPNLPPPPTFTPGTYSKYFLFICLCLHKINLESVNGEIFTNEILILCSGGKQYYTCAYWRKCYCA